MQRTVGILEEITALAPTMKADVIRSVSLQDEKESKEKFKALRQELNWLSSLEFNQKELFSQNGKDTSFKLFKDAGPNAPVIKQHAAPHFLDSIQNSGDEIKEEDIHNCLQALQEMLGQTDAAETDLQTSFKALAADPEAQKKLKFIEDRVKTWVSEVIEGQDGLAVQANLLTRRVDNLVQGLQGLIQE